MNLLEAIAAVEVALDGVQKSIDTLKAVADPAQPTGVNPDLPSDGG